MSDFVTLSNKTLEELCHLINGDQGPTPYQSGRQLVDFFNKFGENDWYGQGFPARAFYTHKKLAKFNGTNQMKHILCDTFNFWNDEEFDPIEAIAWFNRFLVRDGYRLDVDYLYGRSEGSKYIPEAPYVSVRRLIKNTVIPGRITSVQDEEVREQYHKARAKIETEDYSGAIANAYTLVEGVLKLLLRETETEFKETTGDIRSLYKILSKPLQLDPSSDSINKSVKPILNGLQTEIAGFYEISNKASDRHIRNYTPAKHHAELAVNCACTICDFLLESFAYQKSKK